MRLSKHVMLVLTLLTAGPVLADTPLCGSVLTDTSLSGAARREATTQCLQASCEQEARELQLASDATARFMKMCVADEGDLASDQATTSARLADSAAGTFDGACTTDAQCADASSTLEATAAGMRAGGRTNSGHTFVRVPRINEVIEP